MATPLLLAILLALLSIVLTGNCSLESVPDLEQAMYRLVDGKPCVRLLNMYGEFGCANPGRDKVVAPIRRYTTLDIHAEEPVAILLPYSLLHVFLEKTIVEPSFAKNIAGVLVESENNTVASSPDRSFPQAEFAPYPRRDYRWNPSGTGVLFKRYGFPVYLLSEESTSIIRKAAAENEARNGRYPSYVAELDFVMQTTKSGTHTTASCLKESSCLPLGGYSVWSSFPPINHSSFSSSMPTLLVLSAMDSASFFRDLTPGADSPISGLIALLAAVDAISSMGGIRNLKKQVVFLVCTGEAWGYLGSRRFLLELEAGEASVKGLNVSRLHQILEVGSVGRAAGNTFYAHSQDREEFPATEEIIEALKLSARGLKAGVATASRENPGIPPSSLMVFLQKNPSLAGVVLQEFDNAFTNKAFHSHLDNAENINPGNISTAASILARAIYRLASDDTSVPDSLVANSSLVTELVSCLLLSSPGMDCELARSLVTPTQAVANHYVGVFLGTTPSELPSPDIIDQTAQFIWNFLADRTKEEGNSGPPPRCSFGQKCADPSQACVGATNEHKGSCVFSTASYVPAYSTRLKLGSKGWELLPVEAGDVMDSVDPVWTESFWTSLNLRVYVKGDPALDRLILLLGCGITLFSALATLGTQKVFRKRLKRA